MKFLDQCEYIEFSDKHPKAKKESRVYLDAPDSDWRSYGVQYPSGFLKVDIDDLNHKTGELEEPIHGKARSETVIDLLNEDQYKYFGIRTSHGVHLFFRVPESMKEHIRNKQNWVTPINIKAEWKFPESDDHIPLMIDGVKREIFSNPDVNEIAELPYYLYPLQKSRNRPFDMNFTEGNRTQPLGGYLFYLVKDKGFTQEQAFDCVEILNFNVFENPIPEDDFYTQIENDSTAAKLKEQETAPHGKKEVNPETFKRFISDLGITVRYNELLNIVEYLNIPDDMREINDTQNQMPTELQYRFREYTGVKNIGKMQTTDLISLEADKNAYNPVRDYLKSGSWDGVDRFTCQGGIYEILGVSDSFQQGLIRKWFYQAAAMPFNEIEKPFQPEGVLILQGREGIGKTRFFSQLVPVPVWFSSLDKELTTKNKDILIQILGAWISEVGEIDRTFKANKSDVKNFMTLPMDSIRKPYAREPVTKARTTAFCGTTNKAEFLNDDTGFRRWWVIPVNKRITVGEFAKPDNLLQFWSQCYHEFVNNPLCFRLNSDEIGILEENNKEVTETLPAEDELRTRLDFDAPVEVWSKVRPAVLRTLPEYDVVKYTAKEIGQALSTIMKDCPDIKKGRDGRGMWYLLPPAINPTDRYRNKDEPA